MFDLKHLIACNNAKHKVKDFSGCVTGVIITRYTILDLAALMMYITCKFILSCYIRRLYVGDMGGFGMLALQLPISCMPVFYTIYSLLQEKEFFSLSFFAIIPM